MPTDRKDNSGGAGMIRLEGICKDYPLSGVMVPALSNVQLHIAPREFVAIVGPSGSGKSTLMNIIGCLDKPSAGRYYLDGQEVGSLSEKELADVRGRKIGFVFQGFQLLTRLTALENVELPLMLMGMDATRRRRLARYALDRVGLSTRIEHKPMQLSGGQQQRVAVARALVHGPTVILADEPTGNLDPKASADVLALLCELHAQGNTIVLITHDETVSRRAQRRVIVQEGRLFGGYPVH